MVFCYLKHGYWESRQSLIYGPFGLAYGLGGVLLSYLLFKDTKKAWWKVFIKSYIWGTVAEYICSLGEELVFGHVSWDYSKMPLNINGRVCALYSVFWGIMGLVWVKLIYPLFMKLIHKIPLKIGKVLFWIMFILILIDIILVLFCHIGRFLFKGKYHLAKFIATNSFSIYLPACFLHIVKSAILYQGSFGGQLDSQSAKLIL